MSLAVRTLLVKSRRWLRCLYADWRDLAIVSGAAFCGSSGQRSQAKLLWAIWLCKLDFAGIHGLLNDLLW